MSPVARVQKMVSTFRISGTNPNKENLISASLETMHQKIAANVQRPVKSDLGAHPMQIHKREPTPEQWPEKSEEVHKDVEVEAGKCSRVLQQLHVNSTAPDE